MTEDEGRRALADSALATPSVLGRSSFVLTRAYAQWSKDHPLELGKHAISGTNLLVVTANGRDNTRL